jgi:two-component system OmpR family response regulator
MMASPLKQVLVIEDDDSLRDLIATSLRLRGFYVREAADGLAGLRVLEAYDPDVVILDLGLPIASGFDVINEVQAPQARLTPVIVISGFEDRLALARNNRDVVAALAKPFDMEELVRVVERATLWGPVIHS